MQFGHEMKHVLFYERILFKKKERQSSEIARNVDKTLLLTEEELPLCV